MASNKALPDPDTLTPSDLPFDVDEVYEFAIDLGRRAGQLLLDALTARRSADHDDESAGKEPQEKMNAVDIVTQTDNELEEFIHNAIKSKYPDHDFIGEETYSRIYTHDAHQQSNPLPTSDTNSISATQIVSKPRPQPTAANPTAGLGKPYLVQAHKPTWIVDPLDGTVNFTHAFPMFCISIALVYNHRSVVGVISAPMLNQLFHAALGRGAWLSSPLPQSQPLVRRGEGEERGARLPFLGLKALGPMAKDAPRKCLFSCEWGKDRRDPKQHSSSNLGRKVSSFTTMALEPKAQDGNGGMVHGVRSLGSATLDLAYIAMGSFDIWWEGGCWEWDVAAGICLVEEAGGLVVSAKPPFESEGLPSMRIPRAHLGGRLYLAIRPAGDGKEETGRESQERTIREVWKRVSTLDYSRPGL